MGSRTIEFYDDGRTWRNTVQNDSVVHSASPDKITFSHVSPQDSISYTTSTDKIHYTRGQVMGSIQRRSAFKKVFVAPPPPPSPAEIYDSVVAEDSPLAVWHLDEISGTVAADSAGAIDGEYIGGVTLGGPSIVATGRPSVLFNGTNSYVRILSNPTLNLTAAWAWEAWIFLTTSQGGVVLAEDYPSDNRVLYKMSATGNGAISPGFYNGSWREVSGGTVSYNTSHHICGSWDGTTLRAYLDGTQVASGNPGSSPSSGFNGMYIGKRWDNAYAPYYSGRISEVAVYPTALSADRVLAHYNAGI
jgi:hypothetical protein